MTVEDKTAGWLRFWIAVTALVDAAMVYVALTMVPQQNSAFVWALAFVLASSGIGLWYVALQQRLARQRAQRQQVDPRTGQAEAR